MAEANYKSTMITHDNPKSPVSEAYRTLRTNIQFSSIDREVKVIMVTSASPGEGKTTTSTNLAITYAQTERRVLLIDADMRKPSIHKVFLKTNMKGLSTIISGQTSIESTIQPTLVNHLSLLTSGPIPPNPSEILGSQRMGTLLQDLKKQFDIIIIDTPPALAVTDAQLLSTKCDGVLLVIRHGYVKQEHAVKVKAMFDYVQAKIFGVVINNISRKTAESYNYYYYYKYYGSKVDEGKDV